MTSIGLKRCVSALCVATLTSNPTLAGECTAAAIRDTGAIFRDEGMIWDKCADLEDASDCMLTKGSQLLVTGIALLPSYTTETFFFLRDHPEFTCYPAEDFDLSSDCDPKSLGIVNEAGCQP